jgi:ATP-dependent RNA helicase SUPV3L1/SUV3
MTVLLDVFKALATVNSSHFFLCQLDDMRNTAEHIEHINLPLKVRYTFCLAPVPQKAPIVSTQMVRMARRFRYVPACTRAFIGVRTFLVLVSR